MSEKDKIGCLWTVVGLLSTPLANIWRGWVLAKLWAWFIVATFGVRALTIPQAIGLSITLNFLTSHTCDCEKPQRTAAEEWGRVLVLAFLGPALALLMGWIVRGFL